MKASLSRIFASVLTLAGPSLLGCSSESGGFSTGPGSGGSQGGAITALGGMIAGATGGASTTSTSAGGATGNGGTLASGGQTQSQASTVAQGGAASGGRNTSTMGGTGAGGSVAGGSTTDGGVIGGALTGGAALGGTTATGGAATGGSATGGQAGGATGATGGAGTGGKTTTGGTTSASGGTTAGDAMATGGATTGGGLGSSDGKTPIKVWMADDSTMAGGPTTACAACPCGYGSQLAPLFNSNVTVVNNAVGGLTIQTWLYQGVSSTPDANGECAVTNTAFNSRWTNMLSGPSAMKAGDYLFISFGINDGDSSCPKHVGEAKYLGYLNLMARAAKDLGAEPILMSPVGAIGCSADGSTAINIRTPYFTTATNDAGTAKNVPVIDLGALSVALYDSLGLCPNSADYTSTTSKVGQFFCQDHTHFELAGAKQIAQLIAKALKDQGIGLGAYVL